MLKILKDSQVSVFPFFQTVIVCRYLFASGRTDSFFWKNILEVMQMEKQAAPDEAEGRAPPLTPGLLGPPRAKAPDPLSGALECRVWPTLWNPLF